jgi:small subunit ribosomal protein S9
MADSKEMIMATGRRKCAVARVRLIPGSGNVVVNGKAMNEYFNGDALCGFVNQVFTVSETAGKFDVAANCDGGGMAGQAGALRHGIARALIGYDEELRAALKKAGMVTRDARVKERKKSGQPGARRRFQFSKR